MPAFGIFRMEAIGQMLPISHFVPIFPENKNPQFTSTQNTSSSIGGRGDRRGLGRGGGPILNKNKMYVMRHDHVFC
jgi:hypothetical protein